MKRHGKILPIQVFLVVAVIGLVAVIVGLRVLANMKMRAAKQAGAEATPASEAKGGPKPGMLVNDRWAEDRLPDFVEVRFKLDRFLDEYNYDRVSSGIPIWAAHGVFYFTPGHGDSARIDYGEEKKQMSTENSTYPCQAIWKIANANGAGHEVASGSFNLPDAGEFNTPGGKVWIRRIAWFETNMVYELPD